MSKELVWLHDAETLNSAIRVLKEECEHHNSCKDCPLKTFGGCMLQNTDPCRYEEAEDYD